MSHHKDVKGTLYHIRVKGNLDPKWVDWFDGFVLASCGDDETLLSGRVADQAALHGMLSKINSLGIRLILVIQMDHSYTDTCCPPCCPHMNLKL